MPCIIYSFTCKPTGRPSGLPRSHREGCELVGTGESIQTQVETGDRYRYRLNAAGAAIVEKCEAAATEVRVPQTLDGHVVAGIGDSAFARMFTVKRVVLPEGLESIGPNSFKSCVTLRSVELPSTLRAVGSQAFRATALESLSIPASCTDVEDDSFCLLGSWQSPPSTIRPSTLAHVSVDPGNPHLRMEGGVLCRRRADGLRAVLCPNSPESVSLTGNITSVLPAAFTGVGCIPTVRLSERVRSAGREVVFPGTACETLVVVCADGEELRLFMPSEDVARKTLARMFRASAVDLQGALKTFDDELRTVPDKLASARAKLDRLCSGRFLQPAVERRYRMTVASSLQVICLDFAYSSYWRGFDQLLDCGLLKEGDVARIVDVLAQYDEVAAAGYLLQAKRRRFGEAVWDYAL